MNIIYISLYLLVCIFTRVSAKNIKYIIWDAGSTLTTIQQMGIAQEMGAKTIIKMLVRLGGSRKVRDYMMEVFEQYAGKQQTPETDDLLSNDSYGKPLPQFMSDTWLCSRIPNKELLHHISRAIDQWRPQDDLSPEQKQLVKKIMQTALSARILGKNTICPQGALTIVQKLAKKGYRQYILSNFDKESFEIAYANERNQDLWGYIPREHVLISGDCGMIKPHKCMFAYFLQKYQLNPHECLLIDDQLENIEAARKYGIQTIHLKKQHYHRLGRKLKKRDIL